MKVICKCCHKAFDYDMYMGLCPKCGRVYRRGKEHYSAVEKDMAGEFHLHGEEGGLNRGISGVVYNQGSGESRVLRANGFDEDDMPQSKYVKAVDDMPAAYVTANKTQKGTKQKMVHSGYVTVDNPTGNNIWAVASSDQKPATQGAVNQQVLKQQFAAAVNNRANGYYSPNHKTKMNQQVVRQKKGSSTVGLILFILIIVMSILTSVFD